MLAALALVIPAKELRAQLVETHDFNGVNKEITDNDSLGVTDVQNVTSDIASIGSVKVTLTIVSKEGDSAFNGDLYVNLTHGGENSVLLNRVGAQAQPLGYSDAGFDHVTFSDSAANGDVHVYRLTLNGDHSDPLGGPLTGEWQPDARSSDPDTVDISDARTEFLSSFQGLDPDGEWTLFLADLSGGGVSTLESWSLSFTPVPEPSDYAMGFGFLCLTFLLVRRMHLRNG